MNLKRLEAELNVKKMETGILEKKFAIQKLLQDIKRIEDHIVLMEETKKENLEKLKGMED